MFSYTGNGGMLPATCTATTALRSLFVQRHRMGLSTTTIAGADNISGLLTFDGKSAVSATWYVASGATNSTGQFIGTIRRECGMHRQRHSDRRFSERLHDSVYHHGDERIQFSADGIERQTHLHRERTHIMRTHCLISAIFVSLVPLYAVAQTVPPTCSSSTLSRVRSIALTGRDLSPSAAVSQTFQSVGTATFDGVSGVTLALTTNTNSRVATKQTLSSTYALGANCCTSETMTITSGDSAAFTLIAYNKSNGFTITGQDGTYVFAGTGSPEPLACITSTLSGSYAFSGNGYILTSGSVTGVNGISGLLQFDGRGGVTGNWSVSSNGTAASDSLTGTYTVTSSCLANATLTDGSATAFTVNMAVTSADGGNFALDLANATVSFSANAHSTFTNPGLALASAASGSASSTPPGSIFALYGSGMATGSTQANKLPLPGTLLNTSVTVNGETAPLFYMSSGQINAQMPWDIQPGVASVVVTTGNGMSNSAAVNVPATATPEVFIYGSNRAAVQNPDLSVNSSTAPAHVGDTVVAYFTGGGPVNPAGPLTTGLGSPNGLSPVTGTPMVVTVAGVATTITYIGLTPTEVGLYQVNFVVPKVAAGDRTLAVTIGSSVSTGSIMTVAN